MKIVKVVTVNAGEGFEGQPITFDEKHWSAIRAGMVKGNPFEIRVQGGSTVIFNPRNIVEVWLTEIR